MNALTHFAHKLADETVKVNYRLNDFLMAKNMYGAATQDQATDLWTYLVAEARGHHGAGPKE